MQCWIVWGTHCLHLQDWSKISSEKWYITQEWKSWDDALCSPMGACGMNEHVTGHPILTFLFLYYTVIMSALKKKTALTHCYLSTRIHELTIQKAVPLVFISVRIFTSEIHAIYWVNISSIFYLQIFWGKLCQWLDMGFGLNTEFNVCLLRISTNSYRTFTNTHSKISQSAISLHIHCLVAPSNHGDCCASMLSDSWLISGYKYWLSSHNWCPEQNNTLLLQHILGFRPHQEWLYFCSFQKIYEFWNSVSFSLKRGIGLSVSTLEYSSNLPFAFTSTVIFSFGPNRSLSWERRAVIFCWPFSALILGSGPHWHPYTIFICSKNIYMIWSRGLLFDKRWDWVFWVGTTFVAP